MISETVFKLFGTFLTDDARSIYTSFFRINCSFKNKKLKKQRKKEKGKSNGNSD